MDNMQFCYWLQGAFELGRARGAERQAFWINKQQVRCVQDHIDLVNRENAYTCTFIQWLQGVLDATRILTLDAKNYGDISKAIEMKLEEVFEKKTPTPDFDAILNPPPHFPTLREPGQTCSTADAPKVSLEEVLDNIDKQDLIRPPAPHVSRRTYCGRGKRLEGRGGKVC